MVHPAQESALLVSVPAAEPAVSAHRSRLDPGAPLGVPAHITVLYPFLPPAAIGDDVRELQAAEEAVRPHLPIAGEATEVVLMTNSPGGSWTTVAAFPLG